ncbi:quinolinate synthase NadA, partial [Mycobacterium tuberculosis]|uniref:quinolinate synthase NadA n=1 Tax=Mycobacterium tuberculosis TaxID=1773 RepID=UPI0004F38D39
MTVLNRTDTLVDELTADITNTPLGYGVDGDERWAAEIRRLAHLRGATVLAHNYQLPAIQDVADHVGDSLADSITPDELRAWKDEHPGAVVVSYVNTTA